MQELAQSTFTYEQFPEVMSMLWKRMLQENKRNWRRTYKVKKHSKNTIFVGPHFVLIKLTKKLKFDRPI